MNLRPRAAEILTRKEVPDHARPGPRGPRGPKPRVENPGKLMGRLLKYVGKNYGIHLVIVAVCIFVSVIANVQGTMFMKNLIDLYIMPLIGQNSPDFGPLLERS